MIFTIHLCQRGSNFDNVFLFSLVYQNRYKSRGEGKDQGSIQTSTTPGPGYDNVTDTQENIIEVSPFPAGDNKAA